MGVGALIARSRAVQARDSRQSRVVRFYRAAGIDGIEASRTTSRALAGAARLHDSHMFFWMEIGEIDVVTRSGRHRIGPGSTHYMAPGELVVERNFDSPTTHSCAVMVAAETLSSFACEGGNHSQMFLKQADLCLRARSLFASVEGGVAEPEQRLRLAELDQSWRVASGGLLATTTERRAVRVVRAFIHQHVTETILLDQLGEVAGLSKFHLLRLFRASVGVPPHTYQVCLRLARAKSLLGTHRSLAHVAADAGFTDESHLIRHWRRAYGGTPGAYARGQS